MILEGIPAAQFVGTATYYPTKSYSFAAHFVEVAVFPDRLVLRAVNQDLRVADEALPALRVPIEEHPDPVFLIGIAKHSRALGPVLLSLLGALG